MLKRLLGISIAIFCGAIVLAQVNYFDKGFDAFQREKFDNAVYFYSLYLEDFPSANTYFNRGLAYYKLGEFNKAIQDFNVVIGKEPEDFEAWYNRGLAHLDAGNIDSAIRDYEKSIALHPDFDKAYTGLGLSFAKQKDYKKAIQFFDKAIEFNDKQAVNYYNRGLAYRALNDKSKAIEDISKAISLSDDKVDYYISRADLFHQTGAFNESVMDYSHALTLSPESKTLYYNRGISKYDLKDFEEAIEDFEEALLYDSAHINSMWYLALCHKELGNELEAKKYYEMVENLNPDYEYLWSIDKNQLVLKKFIKDNWIYAIALIVLLLASLFFVRKLVKAKGKTEID